MFEFSNEYIRFERAYDKEAEAKKEEYKANMKIIRDWNESWSDNVDLAWNNDCSDREVYYEMEF